LYSTRIPGWVYLKIALPSVSLFVNPRGYAKDTVEPYRLYDTPSRKRLAIFLYPPFDCIPPEFAPLRYFCTLQSAAYPFDGPHLAPSRSSPIRVPFESHSSPIRVPFESHSSPLSSVRCNSTSAHFWPDPVWTALTSHGIDYPRGYIEISRDTFVLYTHTWLGIFENSATFGILIRQPQGVC
jgi:hypothetical protein